MVSLLHCLGALAFLYNGVNCTSRDCGISDQFVGMKDPRFVASCSCAVYPLFDRRRSGRKTCIRVSVRPSRPYTSTTPIDGMDFELLSILAEKLDFQYSLTDLSAEYAEPDENNAKMVFDLIGQDAYDLAIGGLASTYKWGSPIPDDYPVRYPTPYIEDSIIILQRKVMASMSINAFPITLPAFLLSMAVLAIWTSAFWLTRIVLERNRCRVEPYFWSPLSQLRHTMTGTAPYKRVTNKNKCRKVRFGRNMFCSQMCLAGFGLFGLLCLTALYNQLMTTQMQLQYANDVVKNLKELIAQPHRRIVMAKRSSAAEWFQRRSDLPLYGTIWNRTVSQPVNTAFVEQRAAVNTLINDTIGSMVFIGYKRRTIYRSGTDSQKTCGFYIPTTDLGVMWRSFPVHRDAVQFERELSEKINFLRACNIPERLYQRWSTDTGLCQTREKAAMEQEESPLLLKEVKSVYFWFSGACLLATLIFIIERILACKFVQHC